uniref:Mucolipin extracytosolic domain-containing protein n=1 Tax=Neogobius melanostomus TaxID=47308 RepID=A0A8C6V1W0_9GOBI
ILLLSFILFSCSSLCLWVQHTHQSLRRKIKYYFMNPCEKFYARGRKPWKLCLQLVKIVIITIQLVSFGLSNQMVVTFKEENLQSFKHLFLKDYADGNMDTYAVYRQADTYDHIDYIIEQYRLLHNTTVGNHEYEKNGTQYSSLELCQAYYRNGTIYPGNETFEIDAEVENGEHHILAEITVAFDFLFCFRMLSVTIKFVLKAINLQTVGHRELPDCYDFTVLITFDNKAHSGQIKIDLDTDVEIKECRDWKVTGACKNMTLTVLFDCLIIITCITSFSLCLRSVLTGIRLQRVHFFLIVATSYQ